MAVTSIPNEVQLEEILFATETIPGTYVAPTTGRLLGTWSASPGIGAIRRSQEATGLYDRTTQAALRSTADPSGSYTGDLTFEEFAILMRYCIKGGGTGVSDAETTPGYTYSRAPSGNVDDIDTMSVVSGVDGFPWQSLGVRFNEFTIAGDATNADNAWTFSGTPIIRDVDYLTGYFDGVATGGTTSTAVMTGAAWSINEWQGCYFYQDYGTHIGEIRRIASNTADTLTLEAPVLSGAVAASDVFHIAAPMPVVPSVAFEKIMFEGTEIYLDDYNPSVSAVGTTLISDRLVSFSVGQTLNLSRKRRASGVIGRMGRGAREIFGVIRLELDRPTEYRKWKDRNRLSLRIQKVGSVIDGTASPDPTTKIARMDFECIEIDGMTPDADNNNRTASFAFVAELPTTGNIATFLAKNTLATLP